MVCAIYRNKTGFHKVEKEKLKQKGIKEQKLTTVDVAML